MADKNLRLQVILQGLDKLTAPLKSITGASSAARKDLAKTGEELKHLNALQKQVGNYKAKESRFAADTRAYEQQQAQLAKLRADLAATEKPTKKLRTEFERAERQAAMLGAKLDAEGADLQQLSAKLSAAGIDVADLARHEDRLAERVGHANQALRQQTAHLEKVNRANANSQKLSDISGKASNAGLGMIAAGTAAGAPIALATKQAMTLESAMADVRKVVNFDTPEAFQKMSDDILDISARVPMAAEGIAQIVAAAGRANVPRQELLRFAEDAAKMGVAFDTSAEDAGEMMAKWRTAFGLGQNDVVALADQVNALTNAYGGNVAGVSEMVTRIGPLGKVGGLAASEIASMAQVLSSVGVESEIGATGIKNMMLALTKGEAATKSQSQAFEKLGLDAVQMSKDMQKDAGGAILTVMERLKALPKEAQAGVLTDLFGSESVAAIAPMLTSLDQLKKNFALVGDSSQYAGSMQKEYLAATATTEGATGLATNGLSALNITMGQFLLPTVVAVSGYVREAAGAMRGWAHEHPMLAKGIMIFLAAGSALLILLGGMALAFAALTAAAAPLGIALGPLLLIVAAIAAVAAAAYLIYDNWGAVVGFFTSIWNRIKAAFDEGIWGLIKLNLELGGLLIGALWVAIKAVIGALPTIVGALWTAMKWIFWNGLMLLPRLLFQLGINTIKGLVNGLMSMFPKLRGVVTRIGNMLPDGVRKLLDIHSPSRVFAEIGGHVMAGLDQGLAANTSGPISRITDLSGQMTRALAIGAGAGAMAVSAPASAASPSATSSAAARGAGGATYNITINAGAAAQPQDIADLVRKAIEQHEREKRGREFADRDY
jgi:TP901 family phage tail tape measure protein